MQSHDLIREARSRAGITQAELARRLGTTQSAVARLEAAGASPRLATLERAVEACGGRVELSLAPAPSSVDETLVARMLRMSPGERLLAFEESYEDARQFALAAARSRG